MRRPKQYAVHFVASCKAMSAKDAILIAAEAVYEGQSHVEVFEVPAEEPMLEGDCIAVVGMSDEVADVLRKRHAAMLKIAEDLPLPDDAPVVLRLAR